MTRALTALACLATLFVSWTAIGRDEVVPHSVRLSRYVELSAPPQHLKPTNGRKFCRGPRSLRNHYPYVCVTSASERKDRRALELRVSTVHELLEPITTEAAARELTQLLSGGIVIEDRGLYDEIMAEARKQAEKLEHWGAKFKDGTPTKFGETVTAPGNGFVVERLVYSCAGYGALGVIAEKWTIPDDGPVKIERTHWLAGPPQSWQTSSFGMDEESMKKAEEEQKAMHREVAAFRAAMFVPIASRRKAHDVESQAAALTFAAVRKKLGEPDCELQGRLYGSKKYEAQYVYGVPGGTAVVFTSRGEDEKLGNVRIVSGIKLGNDGKFTLGDVMRELN